MSVTRNGKPAIHDDLLRFAIADHSFRQQLLDEPSRLPGVHEVLGASEVSQEWPDSVDGPTFRAFEAATADKHFSRTSKLCKCTCITGFTLMCDGTTL